MKNAMTRLALAALLPLLLLSACVDQTEDPISGIEASINYVGIRQVDGQYQLGLDYTVLGATGDVNVTVYIDDKAVVTGVTEPMNKASVEDGVVFVDIDNPGTANHTVYIVAKDGTGQESASNSKTWSRAMRKALVEIITSANCTPCAPANEEYHVRTESEVARMRIATVKYHVWWPRPTDSLYKHSRSWVEPRVKSYLPDPTTWVAPSGFVDGLKIGNKAGDWVQQATLDMELPAGAELILNKIDNGSSVDIGIDVRGISTAQYSDLKLLTIVTESDIVYNDGNAEPVHYEVMKRILPDASGEAVTIPNGQTITYTHKIDILEGEIKNNMTIVVVLQSESTKEVLQAATIDL